MIVTRMNPLLPAIKALPFNGNCVGFPYLTLIKQFTVAPAGTSTRNKLKWSLSVFLLFHLLVGHKSLKMYS